MISRLRHFSLCLCTGNRHRSHISVGSLLLLSMIVHVISDPVSSRIDPTTTVRLQQLETVSSDKYLMKSTRKRTNTVHSPSLSSKRLETGTLSHTTLYSSAIETSPDSATFSQIYVLQGSKQSKQTFHSEMMISVAVSEIQPSPSALKATTTRKSVSILTETHQLSPSSFTELANYQAQKLPLFSSETLSLKSSKFSTLPTADLNSAPLRISSMPVESIVETKVKILEAGDLKPSSTLSCIQTTSEKISYLSLSNHAMVDSKSETLSLSATGTFSEGMLPSQVTSSSFPQNLFADIPQSQKSFSDMNVEIESVSHKRATSAAVFPTKLVTVTLSSADTSTANLVPTETAAVLSTKTTSNAAFSAKKTSNAIGLPTATSTTAVFPSNTSIAVVFPTKISDAAMLHTKIAKTRILRTKIFTTATLLATTASSETVSFPKTSSTDKLHTKSAIFDRYFSDSRYFPLLSTVILTTDENLQEPEKQYISQEITLLPLTSRLLHSQTQSSTSFLTSMIPLEDTLSPLTTKSFIQADEEIIPYLSLLKTSTQNLQSASTFSDAEPSELLRQSVGALTAASLLTSVSIETHSTRLPILSSPVYMLPTITLPLLPSEGSSSSSSSSGQLSPSFMQRLNTELTGESWSFRQTLLKATGQVSFTKRRHIDSQSILSAQELFAEIPQISPSFTEVITESSSTLFGTSELTLPFFTDLIVSNGYRKSSVMKYKYNTKQASSYRKLVIPEEQEAKLESTTDTSSVSSPSIETLFTDETQPSLLSGLTNVQLKSLRLTSAEIPLLSDTLSFTTLTKSEPESVYTDGTETLLREISQVSTVTWLSSDYDYQILSTGSVDTLLTKTSQLSSLFLEQIGSIPGLAYLKSSFTELMEFNSLTIPPSLTAQFKKRSGLSSSFMGYLDSTFSVEPLTVTKLLPSFKSSQSPMLLESSTMVVVLDALNDPSPLMMSRSSQSISSSYTWSLMDKLQLSAVTDVSAFAGTQSTPLIETIQLSSLFTEFSVIESMFQPKEIVPATTQAQAKSISTGRIISESDSMSSASPVDVLTEKLQSSSFTESVISEPGSLSLKPTAVLAFHTSSVRRQPSPTEFEAMVSGLESLSIQSTGNLLKETPHLQSSFTKLTVSEPGRLFTEDEYKRSLLTTVPSPSSFTDMYSKSQSQYSESTGASMVSSLYAELSITEPLYLPPEFTETVITGIPKFSSTYIMPIAQALETLSSRSTELRYIDTQSIITQHLSLNFSEISCSELQGITSTQTGTHSPELPGLSTAFITGMVSQQVSLTLADKGYILTDLPKDIKSLSSSYTEVPATSSLTESLFFESERMASLLPNEFSTDILQLSSLSDADDLIQDKVRQRSIPSIHIPQIPTDEMTSEPKVLSIASTESFVEGILHPTISFSESSISNAESLAPTSTRTILTSIQRVSLFSKIKPLQAQNIIPTAAKAQLIDIAQHSSSVTELNSSSAQKLYMISSETLTSKLQILTSFVEPVNDKQNDTAIFSENGVSESQSLPDIEPSKQKARSQSPKNLVLSEARQLSSSIYELVNSDFKTSSSEFKTDVKISSETMSSKADGEIISPAITELTLSELENLSQSPGGLISTNLSQSESEISTNVLSDSGLTDFSLLSPSFTDITASAPETSSSTTASIFRDIPVLSSLRFKKLISLSSTAAALTDLPNFPEPFTRSKVSASVISFRAYLPSMINDGITILSSSLTDLKSAPIFPTATVLTDMTKLKGTLTDITGSQSERLSAASTHAISANMQQHSSVMKRKFSDSYSLFSASMGTSKVDLPILSASFSKTAVIKQEISTSAATVSMLKDNIKLSFPFTKIMIKESDRESLTTTSPLLMDVSNFLPSAVSEPWLTEIPKLQTSFTEFMILEPESSPSAVNEPWLTELPKLPTSFTEFLVLEPESLPSAISGSLFTEIPKLSTSYTEFLSNEPGSSVVSELLFTEIPKLSTSFTEFISLEPEILSSAVSGSLFTEIPKLPTLFTEVPILEPESSLTAVSEPWLKEIPKFQISSTEFPILEPENSLSVVSGSLFTEIPKLSTSFTNFMSLEPERLPSAVSGSLFTEIPKLPRSSTEFPILEPENSLSVVSGSLFTEIPKLPTSFTEFLVLEPESSLLAVSGSLFTEIPKLSTPFTNFMSIEPKNLPSAVSGSLFTEIPKLPTSFTEFLVLEPESSLLAVSGSLFTEISKLSTPFTNFMSLEPENLPSAVSGSLFTEIPKLPTSFTEFLFLQPESSVSADDGSLLTEIPKLSTSYTEFLRIEPESSVVSELLFTEIPKLSTSFTEFISLEPEILSSAVSGSLFTEIPKLPTLFTEVPILEPESSLTAVSEPWLTEIPKLQISSTEFPILEPENSLSVVSGSLFIEIPKLSTSFTNFMSLEPERLPSAVSGSLFTEIPKLPRSSTEFPILEPENSLSVVSGSLFTEIPKLPTSFTEFLVLEPESSLLAVSGSLFTEIPKLSTPFTNFMSIEPENLPSAVSGSLFTEIPKLPTSFTEFLVLEPESSLLAVSGSLFTELPKLSTPFTNFMSLEPENLPSAVSGSLFTEIPKLPTSFTEFLFLQPESSVSADDGSLLTEIPKLSTSYTEFLRIEPESSVVSELLFTEIPKLSTSFTEFISLEPEILSSAVSGSLFTEIPKLPTLFTEVPILEPESSLTAVSEPWLTEIPKLQISSTEFPILEPENSLSVVSGSLFTEIPKLSTSFTNFMSLEPERLPSAVSGSLFTEIPKLPRSSTEFPILEPENSLSVVSGSLFTEIPKLPTSFTEFLVLEPESSLLAVSGSLFTEIPKLSTPFTNFMSIEPENLPSAVSGSLFTEIPKLPTSFTEFLVLEPESSLLAVSGSLFTEIPKLSTPFTNFMSLEPENLPSAVSGSLFTEIPKLPTSFTEFLFLQAESSVSADDGSLLTEIPKLSTLYTEFLRIEPESSVVSELLFTEIPKLSTSFTEFISLEQEILSSAVSGSLFTEIPKLPTLCTEVPILEPESSLTAVSEPWLTEIPKLPTSSTEFPILEPESSLSVVSGSLFTEIPKLPTSFTEFLVLEPERSLLAVSGSLFTEIPKLSTSFTNFMSLEPESLPSSVSGSLFTEIPKIPTFLTEVPIVESEISLSAVSGSLITEIPKLPTSFTEFLFLEPESSLSVDDGSLLTEIPKLSTSYTEFLSLEPESSVVSELPFTEIPKPSTPFTEFISLEPENLPSAVSGSLFTKIPKLPTSYTEFLSIEPESLVVSELPFTEITKLSISFTEFISLEPEILSSAVSGSLFTEIPKFPTLFTEVPILEPESSLTAVSEPWLTEIPKLPTSSTEFPILEPENSLSVVSGSLFIEIPKLPTSFTEFLVLEPESSLLAVSGSLFTEKPKLSTPFTNFMSLEAENLPSAVSGSLFTEMPKIPTSYTEFLILESENSLTAVSGSLFTEIPKIPTSYTEFLFLEQEISLSAVSGSLITEIPKLPTSFTDFLFLEPESSLSVDDGSLLTEIPKLSTSYTEFLSIEPESSVVSELTFTEIPKLSTSFTEFISLEPEILSSAVSGSLFTEIPKFPTLFTEVPILEPESSLTAVSEPWLTEIPKLQTSSTEFPILEPESSLSVVSGSLFTEIPKLPTSFTEFLVLEPERSLLAVSGSLFTEIPKLSTSFTNFMSLEPESLHSSVSGSLFTEIPKIPTSYTEFLIFEPESSLAAVSGSLLVAEIPKLPTSFNEGLILEPASSFSVVSEPLFTDIPTLSTSSIEFIILKSESSLSIANGQLHTMSKYSISSFEFNSLEPESSPSAVNELLFTEIPKFSTPLIEFMITEPDSSLSTANGPLFKEKAKLSTSFTEFINLEPESSTSAVNGSLFTEIPKLPASFTEFLVLESESSFSAVSKQLFTKIPNLSTSVTEFTILEPGNSPAAVSGSSSIEMPRLSTSFTEFMILKPEIAPLAGSPFTEIPKLSTSFTESIILEPESSHSAVSGSLFTDMPNLSTSFIEFIISETGSSLLTASGPLFTEMPKFSSSLTEFMILEPKSPLSTTSGSFFTGIPKLSTFSGFKNLQPENSQEYVVSMLTDVHKPLISFFEFSDLEPESKRSATTGLLLTDKLHLSSSVNDFTVSRPKSSLTEATLLFTKVPKLPSSVSKATVLKEKENIFRAAASLVLTEMPTSLPALNVVYVSETESLSSAIGTMLTVLPNYPSLMFKELESISSIATTSVLSDVSTPSSFAVKGSEIMSSVATESVLKIVPKLSTSFTEYTVLKPDSSSSMFTPMLKDTPKLSSFAFKKSESIYSAVTASVFTNVPNRFSSFTDFAVFELDNTTVLSASVLTDTPKLPLSSTESIYIESESKSSTITASMLTVIPKLSTYAAMKSEIISSTFIVTKLIVPKISSPFTKIAGLEQEIISSAATAAMLTDISELSSPFADLVNLKSEDVFSSSTASMLRNTLKQQGSITDMFGLQQETLLMPLTDVTLTNEQHSSITMRMPADSDNMFLLSTGISIADTPMLSSSLTVNAVIKPEHSSPAATASKSIDEFGIAELSSVAASSITTVFHEVTLAFSEYTILEPDSTSFTATSMLTYLPKFPSSVIDFAKLQQENTPSGVSSSIITDQPKPQSFTNLEVLEPDGVSTAVTAAIVPDIPKFFSTFTEFTGLVSDSLISGDIASTTTEIPKLSSINEFTVLESESSRYAARSILLENTKLSPSFSRFTLTELNGLSSAGTASILTDKVTVSSETSSMSSSVKMIPISLSLDISSETLLSYISPTKAETTSALSLYTEPSGEDIFPVLQNTDALFLSEQLFSTDRVSQSPSLKEMTATKTSQFLSETVFEEKVIQPSSVLQDQISEKRYASLMSSEGTFEELIKSSSSTEIQMSRISTSSMYFAMVNASELFTSIISKTLVSMPTINTQILSRMSEENKSLALSTEWAYSLSSSDPTRASVKVSLPGTKALFSIVPSSPYDTNLSGLHSSQNETNIVSGKPYPTSSFVQSSLVETQYASPYTVPQLQKGTLVTTSGSDKVHISSLHAFFISTETTRQSVSSNTEEPSKSRMKTEPIKVPAAGTSYSDVPNSFKWTIPLDSKFSLSEKSVPSSIEIAPFSTLQTVLVPSCVDKVNIPPLVSTTQHWSQMLVSYSISSYINSLLIFPSPDKYSDSALYTLSTSLVPSTATRTLSETSLTKVMRPFSSAVKRPPLSLSSKETPILLTPEVSTYISTPFTSTLHTTPQISSKPKQSILYTSVSFLPTPKWTILDSVVSDSPTIPLASWQDSIGEAIYYNSKNILTTEESSSLSTFLPYDSITEDIESEVLNSSTVGFSSSFSPEIIHSPVSTITESVIQPLSTLLPHHAIKGKLESEVLQSNVIADSSSFSSGIMPSQTSSLTESVSQPSRKMISLPLTSVETTVSSSLQQSQLFSTQGDRTHLLPSATLETTSLTKYTEDTSSIAATSVDNRLASVSIPESSHITTAFPISDLFLSSSLQQSQTFSSQGKGTVLFSSATLETTSLIKYTEVTSSIASTSVDNRLASVSIPESSFITTAFPTSELFSSASISTSISTARTILPPKKIEPVSTLTIGILVKSGVDIRSDEFKKSIKEGLRRCYKEGIAKGSEPGNKRKRTISKVTIEVTDMKRGHVTPRHVNVSFYVLVGGIIQPQTQVLAIFSRLSVAETSAYLSYPVIAPVKLVSNHTVKKPKDQDGPKVSLMTYVLIGVPSVSAVIATIILIIWYCQKGDHQEEQYRPTLQDADLKIDIEKGEVVTASVNRNKNIHAFAFDNGKGNLNPDWKHLDRNTDNAPGYQKRQQKRDLTLERSISEINSASKRLERLRKLGFRGSEIRKHGNETEETRTDTNVYAESSNYVSNLCVINDLDKATDHRLDLSQTESKHDSCSKDIGAEQEDIQNRAFRETEALLLIDKENSPNSSRMDLNIKPSQHGSVSSTRKLTEGLVYNSSDSERKRDDTKSIRKFQLKRRSEHRKKTKLKKSRKMKSIQTTKLEGERMHVHNFAEGEVNSFLPRVPSIPIDGHCYKIMQEAFCTSLTLGREPPLINNFIEGDLEDEVFLADNIQYSDVNTKDDCVSENNISDLKEQTAKLAAIKVKERRKFTSARNYCDIIRTCDANNDSCHADEIKRDDTDRPDDPFYLKACCDRYIDGSEYAGHEFESLNFKREYTNSNVDQPCGPYLTEDTTLLNNMAEGVIGYGQRSGPGVCEHVTKMGRFGKTHGALHSKVNVGPQFRKVPFQDQVTISPRKSSTPVLESSRDKDPVILRDLPKLRYIFPKMEIMKEIGIQTGELVPNKKTAIHQKDFNPNTKDKETTLSETEDGKLVNGGKRNTGNAEKAVSGNGIQTRDSSTNMEKIPSKMEKGLPSMETDNTVLQNREVSKTEHVTGKHTIAERESSFDNKKKKKNSLSDMGTSNQEMSTVPKDKKVSGTSNVRRKSTHSGRESQLEHTFGKEDTLDDTETSPEKKKNGSNHRTSVNKEVNNAPKHEEVPKTEDVTGKKTAPDNEPRREKSPQKMDFEPHLKKDTPQEGDTLSKNVDENPHDKEIAKVDKTTGRKTTFEMDSGLENAPEDEDSSLKDVEKRPKLKRQNSGKQSSGSSVGELPDIVEPPKPFIDADTRPKPRPAFSPYGLIANIMDPDETAQMLVANAVEMKLGRNMRAAPKGSIAPRSPADELNQQLLDVTEPLLNNQPLSSNNIAEYYANTQSAVGPQMTQGATIASRLYPARSITSPQHPSQHLIEMLNRNSHTSLTHETRLEDEPRTQREEQRRELEEEGYKEEIEPQKENEQELETKNALLKESFALTSEPVVVNPLGDITSPPPPPLGDLYGSYRMTENYFVEPKLSDQVSTQPFSPQDSTTFNQGGESSTTTSSLRGTVTHSEFKVYKNTVSVEKQETVEEVEDIAEDIQVEDDDGSDDGKIKDEDFNF